MAKCEPSLKEHVHVFAHNKGSLLILLTIHIYTSLSVVHVLL